MTADPFRKQRITWFLVMNAAAIFVAVGIFCFFMYGDAMDFFFRSLLLGVFEYKLLVVLIAMSPLLASLLVGMAYAKRALRRKQADPMHAAPPVPQI